MPCADWESETPGCIPRVSGLASRPFTDWPEVAQKAVQQLRQKFNDDIEFRRHAAFGVLEETDLARFLLARNGDVEAAVAMIQKALAWRTRRMPYWMLIDPASDASKGLLKEARTGKVVSSGRDRFGRGLCLMDSTVQNTTDGDSQMRHLSYSIQTALQNCAEGVDKICVVVNMEDFSIFNTIPAKILKETIDILTVVYPETLGACIIWQAPRYANALFAMAKKLVDPRTIQKLVWASGRHSPGCEVDKLMCDSVGEDWRELTGLCLPRTERAHSEYFNREVLGARGFNFSSYSEGLISKDTSRAATAGVPPWKLDWSDAIDRSKWDGAWPGYWQSNLVGRATKPGMSRQSSHDRSLDSDGDSELWVTPAGSESDLMELNDSSPDVDTETKEAPSAFLRCLVFLADRPLVHGVVFQQRCGNAQMFSLLMMTCVLVAISTFTATLYMQNGGQNGLYFDDANIYVDFPSPVQTMQIFILTDIPLVGVGFYILLNADFVFRYCPCLSQHCAWVPWGMLLVRVYLVLEAVRTVYMPSKTKVEQFDRGLWSALGFLDMVLGTFLPVSWIRCLSSQRYAKNITHLAQDFVTSEV